MHVGIFHPVSAQGSFECPLPSSGKRLSRFLGVVVKVVLLDVLDRRITVVADGRDRNATFQSKGDPGVAERIPGQGFPGVHVDLPAVVAVVV